MYITRRLDYFLPERLPSDVLITPADQRSRSYPAGTPVRVVVRRRDCYLITPLAEDGAWWLWMAPADLAEMTEAEEIPA